MGLASVDPIKRESLELLRYQRAGQGARWQRRPELH